jgi:hypothetical protein
MNERRRSRGKYAAARAAGKGNCLVMLEETAGAE